MTRPIKFRAWDREKKVMIDNAMGIANIGLGDGSMYVDEGVQSGSELDWMQFTGLLDKNGKEIYEGDVVSCIKFVAGKEKPSKGHVLHNELGRAFRSEFYIEELVSRKVLEGMLASDMGVIGNIYENPDLIKP